LTEKTAGICRTEADGHQAGVDKYHAGADGHQAGVDKYHAGADGCQADIDNYQAGAEGNQVDVDSYQTETDSYQAEMRDRYARAVDSFVDKVRDDPNVIAVIVSGSFTYDVIWEKSDIDMTLVIRDQMLKVDSYCIVEDGITINVQLAPRSGFKRFIESKVGGSWEQSYMSKGKIIYTTDESLYEYFEDIKRIGADDMALAMVYMACELIGNRDKCQKWLTVRKDPLYAQFYLLKCAEIAANMEVCSRQETIGRDSIQKAMKFNPEVIGPLYEGAMSRHMNEDEIDRCITLVDDFLEEKMEIFKRPVLEFMSDQQIKTMTLISKQFRTEGHFIIEAFDYLAEKGVIEKVSQTIRITPKSRMAVEEIGYLYIP